MKNDDKNKESSYLKYVNTNNLYGWAIFQKWPLGGFKWVEEISQFNKDFIKSCDDDSDEGYFLGVYIQYPQNLHNRRNDLPFWSEGTKLKIFWQTCMIKKEYIIHIRNI